MINRKQFDLAQVHCERCLVYSRRLPVESELKIAFTYKALDLNRDLRKKQGDESGTLAFAEECYNFLVEAYDPGHKQVQEAAGILIRTLIEMGDFDKAEICAEITCDNLWDGKNETDQEGIEMAISAYNLADALHRKAKKEKKGTTWRAKDLVREAIDIRIHIDGDDHIEMAFYSDLLADLLRAKNNVGEERKELHERCLAIFIIYEGPDGKIQLLDTSPLLNTMNNYQEEKRIQLI
jgi:hypothetical protein